MSSQQLLAFIHSRPFEPFTAMLVGGRQIEVRHPEFVVPAYAGLGLWLFHDTGHVEAIAAELIMSIRTLSPVDPHSFTG